MRLRVIQSVNNLFSVRLFWPHTFNVRQVWGASIDVYIIRPVLHIKQSLYMPMKSFLQHALIAAVFLRHKTPLMLRCVLMCVHLFTKSCNYPLIWKACTANPVLTPLCGLFFFFNYRLFICPDSCPNHVESNSDAHKRLVNTHGKIAFPN